VSTRVAEAGTGPGALGAGSAVAPADEQAPAPSLARNVGRGALGPRAATSC
jgi:hypothetical protein